MAPFAIFVKVGFVSVGSVIHTHSQTHMRCFSRPTRTYQTYHATPPTFLIWNNLCDLVYQWPTRSYRSQTANSHALL